MTTEPNPAEAATRRAAMRDDVARAWTELQDAVSTLDGGQLAAPGPDGWSIKDHLAHLGHWEQYMLAEIEGGDPIAAIGLEADQERSEDAVNAALQRLDAGLSPADARHLLADAHARLVARMESLSDADLAHWSELLDGNTTSHFDQHRPWIRELAGSLVSGTSE
jgi:DinB superfamily